MPGPGGHSGGGHGGGGGGGSHGGGGGGFHGGGGGDFHGGGFHPPMWGPRPRFGGGCFAGITGMLFVPIVVTLLIICLFVSIFGQSTNDDYYEDLGGIYNEDQLQDYAMQQYDALFGDAEDYEDYLLLLVVTYGDNNQYDYIAILGDDIQQQIRVAFGSDTELGQQMEANINSASYKYSLDTDLEAVMDAMTDYVTAMELESSFVCGAEYASPEVWFVNRTELSISASTVERGLTAFAEATGIPTAIVVADTEAVYGVAVIAGDDTSDDNLVEIDLGNIFAIAAIVIVVILLVIFLVRRRRNRDDDFIYQERDRENRN